MVAGPGRSGRSCVLASMTRSFLAGGAQVILVTPRPSPLRSLASRPGVIGSFTGPGLGEDLLAAIAALTAPGVVVIDDAELLTDCDASGELSKIITRGAGGPWPWSWPVTRSPWPAGSADGRPTRGGPGAAA